MSEVLDDNLEKEENSNGFQLDFEEITPWNGANDTGKDVRMKWLRNFEKIRQNFELLSGLWSLKIDSDGKKYAYTNFPIVGAAGMTLFAGEEIKVDSIFKGLPLDTTTLQWVDGVLTVVGGTGGGEAGFVKWQNIEGKPSWITTEKPKYSYTEITGLVEELGKYVTLSTEQSVTGMKDFANGMKVSGVLFKVINGVLTLDCSIAVTGGITTHAIGEQTTATIMDGIAVDGITITKEDGVLKVVGGGGASNWDELEGKPSWITDIKPVYTWGEITQKPTTLSGYGIQASDVLNVLKTVDGSGSGLDADTLDGKHLSSTKSLFNGIAYIAGDGVMEIGRYLDFHYDSTDTSDYSTRLSISSKGHSNDVYLPIQTGTLALTTDNVASATKLQTARTIWGQSFDGTANVTGSLTSVTNITGTGTFTGANIKATDSVYVNGIRLHKTADGVITLEGNLAVTGGITQFAVNEVSPSTIMDGVVVDGTSIKKENGVLKVMNAGGGEAGSVKWTNINGKPTTLTGYGISASDVLSTLKTVDGSGSGLDADLLDGVHNGEVTAKKINYDNSANGVSCVQFMQTRTQNDAGDLPSSNWYTVIKMNHDNGDTYYNRTLAFDFFSDKIYTRRREKGIAESWRTIAFIDDNVASATNADKLDGVHLNGIFTALSSSSGTNLSATIGGVTKSIADLYANSAAKLQTARTIWGQSFDGTANVTGSLTYVTDITGTGTFTGANIKATDSVYVNGIRLHKTADGVITLEGNLAVTGGITQFAVNEVSPSTIMDGVVVDGTSIKKENGVLKVMNAGGGEAGSVKWTNINGKPTTLTGYGISASDVLSTLKTVDGSGSGLDADLLDGVHNGEVTAKKINYDNSANGVSCVQFMQTRTQNDAGDLPSSNWYTVIKMNHDNGDTYFNRALAFDFLSDKIYTRRRENGIAEPWRTIAFIDDNVASATKLTTNAGTATRPVYFANGIPVAGTYTFGNANGNAAINNGTLCTNLNADMLDGVHNGNLTAAYTHNGDISASLTVTKNDNNGYPVYILIADCTDTINASSGGLHHGFTGIIIESRISGYAYECVSKVIARVGYNDYNMRLTSDNDRIIPYILKNNSKYYIALKVFGSAHQLYFYGFKKNLLSSFIQVNTTDSSGTLPSGYSIEYSGTAMGVYGNASSATKLQTARKIWGQSFDGTKDITGSLNYVDSISAQNIELKFSTPFIDFHYNYSTKDYTSRIIEDGEGRLSINNSLFVKMSDYVGIGTASPSEKLHVNGNLLITGKITSYDYIYADGWFQANSITTGLYNKAGDTRWYGTSNGWVSDKSITVNGNLLVTGGGTFYSSDIRAKIIIERPKLSLNSIANAPVIKFRWNGYNGLKDDNKQHVGGIAQYIEKILPECVIGQKDDFLSFDYATTGYIFSVLTARHLLSYETRTDRIIRKLKERIKRLERQLNIENHEEVCIVAD